MKRILLLFISFFILQLNIEGQNESDPTKDYFIYYLSSGQKYVGIELEKTDTSILIQLENNSKISIPLSVIENEMPSLEAYGKEWIHNPNATRYFYAPSGFGLKKGEGYFQNALLLLNSLSYGFSDYFTVGVGAELYSLFNREPIYFLTPKLSFPVVKNLNVGVGAWHLHAPQLIDNGSSFSIFYGVVTIGSRENHGTFGVGYGYVGKELAKTPILTFSGSFRLYKRIALVTENWSVPVSTEDNYETINTFGIRYMEPEFTVDLSMLGNKILNKQERFIIPFFDLVIPFGKKRFLK